MTTALRGAAGARGKHCCRAWRAARRTAPLRGGAAIARGTPMRFFPWEPIALPEGARGGGGTRFTPVFEWVESEPVRPDALLYFTDAEGEVPERAPEYPVMWLVTGNAPVPFGERVQFS